MPTDKPLTAGWGLNLMAAIAGALLLTGVGLWKSESDSTDARMDHLQAEIDWLNRQAITNMDHIEAHNETHNAAIAALQQQQAATATRISQDEQKENDLDYALHTLSDAVTRLAENKKNR